MIAPKKKEIELTPTELDKIMFSIEKMEWALAQLGQIHNAQIEYFENAMKLKDDSITELREHFHPETWYHEGQWNDTMRRADKAAQAGWEKEGK